jgi:hypothetical protein
MLTTLNSNMVKFADDTAVIAVGETVEKAPHCNTAKYLVMTLDAKLQWKENMKKKIMSSKSSSGNYIGCLESILSCQSTINSYYTSKSYVQFGVMVSSFGAAPV